MAKRKVSRKFKPKKMMEQLAKERKQPAALPKKKIDWKQFIKQIPKRISSFFRGVVRELKKVTWPTRKALLSYTLVVIVTIIIFAAILGLFDFIFLQAVDFLINI
ncbi:MAG: preprotein translocase subunit SecE [Actinomycetota bacterium]|nr:preprotein translocase subunit SecE [Actinomycetota bacterium]